MAAASPLLSPNGLVVGYSGIAKPKTPLSLAPIYGPNGLISSYSGAPSTGTNGISSDYSLTGQSGGLLPSGKTPGQNAADALANDTAVVSKVKNPAIATAETNLLGDSQNVAASATKSFDDYLNEAKATTAGIKPQVATDTANLNALPGQTQAQLDAINKAYADKTSNISNTYAGLNAQNAAQVNSNIADLGTLNQQYETNAQAVADRALQYAGGQISRYQAGSGTPTSNSGDLTQRYINAYTDINLPLQKELSANRISQLENYVTPQERQLYGDTVSQAVGYDTTAANQIASMQTGSAQQIAALKQAVAGRGVSESMAYMQSLGIPISVAQTVLQGPTSNLATLTGIDANNTNYAIASDYQAPVSGSPLYNPPTPSVSPRPAIGYSNPGVNTGTQPMGAVSNPAAASYLLPDGSVNANALPSNPYTPQPIGRTGITNLPNNYYTPSSPQQQAYQAALQAYYEGNGPVPNPQDFGLSVNGAPQTGATVSGVDSVSPDYASAYA